MPSSHPIPTIAALYLSLYTSTRRVERLPRVTTFAPNGNPVDLAKIPNHLYYTSILNAGFGHYEGI